MHRKISLTQRLEALRPVVRPAPAEPLPTVVVQGRWKRGRAALSLENLALRLSLEELLDSVSTCQSAS